MEERNTKLEDGELVFNNEVVMDMTNEQFDRFNYVLKETVDDVSEISLAELTQTIITLSIDGDIS